MAKIIDAKSLLRRRLGRVPTNEEIAEFINVDLSTVQLVCEKGGQPVSIDKSLNEEGLTLKVMFTRPSLITWYQGTFLLLLQICLTLCASWWMQDIIPGSDEARPEVILNKKLMLRNLNKLLATLSERERHIIELHYGLRGERARSCEEIGKLLNLSRERVRQIHWIALAKLQADKSNVECFASSVV